MKLQYNKPLLAVEFFSIAQSNARDCAESIPDANVTLNDPASCKWELGGGASVFIGGDTCTFDGEGFNGYCYNNPGEGSYIFRS